MIFFVMLALLNGVFIVSARTLNGVLAQERSAFYASIINHFVGFIFLSVILLFQQKFYLDNLGNIPFYAFAGGIIGAFFVVINSYVLPQLGVTMTTVLAISGQIISGFIFDIINGKYGSNITLQLIGVLFIFAGIYIKYRK